MQSNKLQNVNTDFSLATQHNKSGLKTAK